MKAGLSHPAHRSSDSSCLLLLWAARAQENSSLPGSAGCGRTQQHKERYNYLLGSPSDLGKLNRVGHVTYLLCIFVIFQLCVSVPKPGSSFCVTAPG